MSNNSKIVYKRYTGSHRNYWQVYEFMTLNISYYFFLLVYFKSYLLFF